MSSGMSSVKRVWSCVDMPGRAMRTEEDRGRADVGRQRKRKERDKIRCPLRRKVIWERRLLSNEAK
jgi:hypothetical protein